MYWFRRPPYLRWAGVAVLVVAAFALELRSTPTTPHPFAASDLVPGDAVTTDVLDWRDIPRHVLPEVFPTSAHRIDAAVRAGEPLLPSHLSTRSPVPPGWWALPLQMVDDASPGSPALVVVADPPLVSAAVVVRPPGDTGFGLTPAGLVAVPPEHAAAVAIASARGAAIVLIEP